MNLDRALAVSAAGMNTQSARLRVVAENLANRDSTGLSPDADPYRRRTITFTQQLDRRAGVQVPVARRVGTDPGEFPMRHEPSHPAADANGYVRLPNVTSLIELSDMREAQRSYNANLAVMETTRTMLMRAIEALRQ
jgi:flagellar basal-body rod protein FlgC